MKRIVLTVIAFCLILVAAQPSIASEQENIEEELDAIEQELSDLDILLEESETGGTSEFENSLEDQKKFRWSSSCCLLNISGEVSHKEERHHLNDDSLLNPDNMFDVPRHQNESKLYLKINAEFYDTIGLFLKGSILRETQWLEKDTSDDTDENLDQAYVSLEFGDGPITFISVGKQRVKWGVAQAWNPVDTFNVKQNLDSNDTTEEGKIMYRTDITFERFDMSGFFVPNMSNSDFEEESFKYKEGEGFIGFKTHFFISDVDITYYWSDRENENPKPGFSFSFEVSEIQFYSEAIRWNGESSLRYPVKKSDRKEAVNPLTGNSYTIPAVYDFETRKGSHYKAVLGTQYTYQSDLTFIAEYYRNSEGYSQEDMQVYLEYMEYVSGDYESDKTSTESALNQDSNSSDTSFEDKEALIALGSLVNEFAELRQNYLRCSIIWNNILNRFRFSIDFLTSLDGINENRGSYFMRPLVSYTAIPDWEFTLYSQNYTGPDSSEFGMRQYKSSITGKVRYYF